MVSVAVPAVEPVMSTGLVEPKLNVGGASAPAGLEVTAAVSATLLVKPPDGVTVMVEVFPEVAPGVTVTAVPVIVKLGIALRFNSATKGLMNAGFVVSKAPLVTGKSADWA
jgi:hypothetical protein